MDEFLLLNQDGVFNSQLANFLKTFLKTIIKNKKTSQLGVNRVVSYSILIEFNSIFLFCCFLNCKEWMNTTQLRKDRKERIQFN